PGAADIFFRLCNFLKPKKAIIIEPAFNEYRHALTLCSCENILRKCYSDDIDVSGCDIVFCCSPANPTGEILSNFQINILYDKCRKANAILVLDSCFSDFCMESRETLENICSNIEKYENLILVNAFTKYYGLAGLRVGFAITCKKDIINGIKSNGQPWAVSTEAQEAAIAALKDFDYEKKLLALVESEREYLKRELEKIKGISKVSGRANFILFEASKSLLSRLEEKGFLVRNCDDFSFLPLSEGKRFYRVCVKKHDANVALINAIKDSLCACADKRKCACLMVQGTMSNAGKSFIVAALCRIFKNKGYKVAPFKSQNMALNSAVTEDGFEIGRAQAMQAEASGKKADVRMNPILLKPNSDTGSQVIVNGRVVGNMSARDYFKSKKSYIPIIKESFESLAAENDVIIVEGAGSPAEINLKQDDIVNMGLAKLLDIPVILASDIDRGGVFAQLYGTIELLENDEKERIKGLIINKFRGDVSILQAGLDKIEELTNKKVVGVVPMLHVDIDDEDSLSERLNNISNRNAPIRIAVIKLAHISNFTDFEPLEKNKCCSVMYVKNIDELDYFNPHLIIIPGTKNTISDLYTLKTSGFEARISQYAARNIPVIGVCGGFQMLGKRISDTVCMESTSPCEVIALSLLDTETVFTTDKELKQVNGILPKLDGFFSCLSNLTYSGYEIHAGKSKNINESFSGLAKDNIFGTYVHGIFDSDEIVRNLLNALAKKNNISLENYLLNTAESYSSYREEQYNKLAKEVEKVLDMNYIEKIMGLC
nr:cobyric acid synthase [Treponema sp.]